MSRLDLRRRRPGWAAYNVVMAWAARVGFVWPEASSSETRGVLRRGPLLLHADAIAGSLGNPSRTRSNQAGDEVA